MGFFYNLQKKKLISYPLAVWRVEKSPDIFLRKFVYTSASITNLFFDYFLDHKSEFAYLNKYKMFLNNESVSSIFRLFAMQDFKAFIAVMRANNLVNNDENKHEKDIFSVFDCTDNDRKIYEKLKETTQNYAESFVEIFFKDCLRVYHKLGDAEVNIFKQILFTRNLDFPKIFIANLRK